MKIPVYLSFFLLCYSLTIRQLENIEERLKNILKKYHTTKLFYKLCYYNFFFMLIYFRVSGWFKTQNSSRKKNQSINLKYCYFVFYLKVLLLLSHQKRSFLLMFTEYLLLKVFSKFLLNFSFTYFFLQADLSNVFMIYHTYFSSEYIFSTVLILYYSHFFFRGLWLVIFQNKGQL